MIYKLGDIADIKGGKRLPKGVNLISAPNAHPYIRVRDLNNVKTLELNESFEYVDDITQKGIAKYIVEKGNILLSIVGTIGLTAIVGETLHGANLTENCVKIIPCDLVDRNYLFYYLKSPEGQNGIKRGTVGAVQSKLPIKNIQDIDVQLPNKNEQLKITKILGSIDDKIELNQKINDNLERQAQAIFENSFIDNPENTAWKVGTFSELIISTINGDWGKEEPTGNNTEKVYCIRGADIPEVKVGNKGKMPTRYILPKNLSSKKLEAGDIVIEISGGSPTQSTGRCAAITQSLLERYDSSMVCTNFCKAIKPKSGYSLFVYFYWQYLYQKDVFFSYENGTTGIKNLDFTGVVETEQIIIPPIDKIARFNDLCASLLDQIFANGKQNEQLASLRDALLPKLMSGELDVSNLEI